MTEPIAPLISLLGAPGAACEGDACLPEFIAEPEADSDTQSLDQESANTAASNAS